MNKREFILEPNMSDHGPSRFRLSLVPCSNMVPVWCSLKINIPFKYIWGKQQVGRFQWRLQGHLRYRLTSYLTLFLVCWKPVLCTSQRIFLAVVHMLGHIKVKTKVYQRSFGSGLTMFQSLHNHWRATQSGHLQSSVHSKYSPLFHCQPPLAFPCPPFANRESGSWWMQDPWI